MAKYFISGPHELPINQDHKVPEVDKAHLSNFWGEIGRASEGIGCYVFGFRAGKGYRPVYVGKTSSGFKYECFSEGKLHKYDKALARNGKGTPVMFLVIQKTTAGRPNEKSIKELEKYLIESAYAKNPELLNVQHANKGKYFEIEGVLNYGKGKPSGAAAKFRVIMGFGK